MSLLIKGPKLPRSCVECFGRVYDPNRIWTTYLGEQEGAYICRFTGNLIDNRKRDDACPLIDVTHCINCKYRNNETGYCSRPEPKGANLWTAPVWQVSGYEFCSRGEPREESEEVEDEEM